MEKLSISSIEETALGSLTDMKDIEPFLKDFNSNQEERKSLLLIYYIICQKVI